MKSFAATEDAFLLARFYRQGLPAHNHQKMAESLSHNLYNKLSAEIWGIWEEEEDIIFHVGT